MKIFTDTSQLREALVALMETQGINQLEISKQTGLPQSTVSLFIRGKRSLSGDSALKIETLIRLPPPALSHQEVPA